MPLKDIIIMFNKVFIESGFRMLIVFLMGVSFLKMLFQKTKQKIKYTSKNTWQNIKSQGSLIDSSNYYKKRNFFTSREDLFYRKLATILYAQTNRYTIFSKTRVVDAIASHSGDIDSWSKISRWHFDYVVCDNFVGFEVVMVIELDDESHQNSSVQYRDTKKNEICKHVGLPLIRFTPQYKDDMIKTQLQEILKLEISGVIQ